MAEPLQQTNISDSNRFLWLFLIGAATMLVLKLLLSLPQLFVTVAPALVMLLYFSQLARGHHATNRPERAGDNIYYLGFLFTLVSLGLALYEFGVNADDKSGLIADFAIALTTTILGVLGRVWLTQGDKEVDEYEKDARLHITDAIDELRDNLKHSNEVLAEFASATRQSLEENRDEQRKQMEQDREAFEAHFKETLEKMGEVLSTAVTEGSQKLSEELERLATSITAQVEVFTSNVESLNTASDALSSSLTGAVGALQAMPNPTELVEEKVQCIVRPLEEATTQMVNVLGEQATWATQSARSVEEVVGTLDSLSASVTKLSQDSGESMARLASPVDAVLARLTAVETALASIARQTDGLQAFTGNLEQVPQRLHRSVEGVDNLAQAIGEATGKLTGSLSALHNDIEAARSAQLQAASEDTGNLRQLADDRQALLAALSAANGQIEGQISQLREQLAGMSEALLGAARYVRTETSSVS